MINYFVYHDTENMRETNRLVKVVKAKHDNGNTALVAIYADTNDFCTVFTAMDYEVLDNPNHIVYDEDMETEQAGFLHLLFMLDILKEKPVSDEDYTIYSLTDKAINELETRNDIVINLYDENTNI